MKLKIMIVVLIVAAAWLAGIQGPRDLRQRGSAVSQQAVETHATTTSDGREEIHQSYTLAPDAKVEVRNISGSLEIEIIEGETAEVHVIRTARDAVELERLQTIIEQTPSSLVIYGKVNKAAGGGNHWWRFWKTGGSSVQQQVTLKLPRRIALIARGVNGPFKMAGALDGALQVKGINGRVQIESASHETDISGINGAVSIGLARLSPEGIKVRGVNGALELQLPSDLHADLQIKGHNGSLDAEVPNLTPQERSRTSLSAQIGTGGTPISISGVNGRIRLGTVSGQESSR